MQQIDLRPRDLGENLGLAFSLALRHFGPLFVLLALLNLPSLAMELLSRNMGDTPDPAQLLGLLAILLVALIAWPVGSGAATAIVAASFTGDRMPIGRAIGVGLRHFLTVVGFSLLTTLIIIAIPMVSFLIAGIFVAVGVPALSIVMMLLAAATLIYPTLWLFARFFTGVPSIIVEGLGVGEAMARSTKLTSGRRGTVILLILVIALVAMVPGMALGFVQVLTVGLENPDAPQPLPLMLATWVLGIVLGIPFAVAPVVAYFSLRCEKESFDVDQLAALVDEIGARDREV